MALIKYCEIAAENISKAMNNDTRNNLETLKFYYWNEMNEVHRIPFK